MLCTNPDDQVDCSAVFCKDKTTPRNGVVWALTAKNGDFVYPVFCSQEHFLKAVPTEWLTKQ
jgi:hypothetical protein